MKIEINHDHNTASIDRDTYKRLAQGTLFQRSLNLVAMLDAIVQEMQDDILKASGVNRRQRRAAAKRLRQKQAAFLRKHPPSNDFDADAIEVLLGDD